MVPGEFKRPLLPRVHAMRMRIRVHGMKNALCLFNTFCRPLFGGRSAPASTISVVETQTYVEHLTAAHDELRLNSVKVLKSIVACNSTTFDIGQHLVKTE